MGEVKYYSFDSVIRERNLKDLKDRSLTELDKVQLDLAYERGYIEALRTVLKILRIKEE